MTNIKEQLQEIMDLLSNADNIISYVEMASDDYQDYNFWMETAKDNLQNLINDLEKETK